MSESLQVGVIGAKGRMGATVCGAVRDAPGMELVAEVDQDDSLEQLIEAGAQVVVVFSIPDTALDHVTFLVNHGIHAVVGTTGWTEDRLQAVRDALVASPATGVLVAPNFALGAVLAMRFAQVAATHFESVEVIELHHPGKVDAPSGTARHTAELVAQARRENGVGPSPDATTTGLPGSRGADVDGVRVHSVRLRGLVAHEEILLGNPGEQLTIRHDSFDRISFMPGVVVGIRAVGSRPGLTVGLEHYLDL